MSNPCADCNPVNNPCAGVSSIAWDAAISSCLSRLGVEENDALSAVINYIAAAVCGLLDAAKPDCSGVLISGTYENIEFEGTDETTLCDLITAIDTRFGNLMNTEMDDCFGTATTIPDAVLQIRTQLCEDLYGDTGYLWLPLAGNNTDNLQSEFFMDESNRIVWNLGYDTDPSITATSFLGGMLLSGGIDGGNNKPIILTTPTYSFFAPRVDFSVLTTASTTLDENTMKPLYFIDKSTVTSVYLPSLAAITIDHPVVTFAAEDLGSAVGAAVIYPANASGDTIQGGVSEPMLNLDSITFVGDKSTANWKIVSYSSF